MKLSRLNLGVVICLTYLAIAPSLSFAGPIVDTFDTVQGPIIVSGLPLGLKISPNDSASGPGIIGGERDLVVTRTSLNTGTIVTDVNGSIPSALAYSAGASTAGTALLTYDGTDGSGALDPIGLGGIDFTAGGDTNAFLLGVGSDLGGILTLTVYTDGANFSTASVLVPVTGDPSIFALVIVPFASFVIAGGTGADFTDVGAIQLLVDGRLTPSTDIGIDFFGTNVPEPASICLAAIGMVGATGIFYRRNKKAAV